jgi:hypothetical protein
MTRPTPSAPCIFIARGYYLFTGSAGLLATPVVARTGSFVATSTRQRQLPSRGPTRNRHRIDNSSADMAVTVRGCLVPLKIASELASAIKRPALRHGDQSDHAKTERRMNELGPGTGSMG